MNENVVQWVMLRRMDYLRQCLDMPVTRKLAEYLSTDYGVIDFAVELNDGRVVLVELETAIDNVGKLNYSIEQTRRYLSLTDAVSKPFSAIVLYDGENTPPRYSRGLQVAARESGFQLREYSLVHIKKLYQECFEQLQKTGGVYLGRPVAMDVCYLKWLNRVMSLIDNSAGYSELLYSFGATNKTGLNVRLKTAEDFDLVQSQGRGKSKRISLTPLGKRFRESMDFPIIAGQETDLSLEQRRVLLESLTNGRFTKSKVNIYYLLRFIHITNGEWIPKGRADIGQERVSFLNHFLGTSYRTTTLTKLVAFTCSQCVELGLVDKIPTPKRMPTYQVAFTTMGSRLLGFLELYLHLKREQIQIPLGF